MTLNIIEENANDFVKLMAGLRERFVSLVKVRIFGLN
jgi:hypothetical protein